MARTVRVLLILCVLLIGVSIAGLSIGSVDIPLGRLAGSLVGIPLTDAEQTILFGIRLPRVLLAIVVGAGLSVAGVVYQALLRNPLAEPYILGISSGGTVGAVIAISISTGAAMVTAPAAAFVGCAVVMALVYVLGHRHGRLDTYALLLAGVMVGAFFNAAVLVGFSILDREVRGAFLWLMGNLSGARMDALVIVGIPLVLAAGILVARGKTFNLIATGEESAAQLGVEVDRFRRSAYLLASLLTGLAVSMSGVIGFVGLVVPHICRILFGPDHRLLLPASFLAGGTFLVCADILSRVVIAPAEIPVGAVTAAIGAPLFVYLLKRA
jgi:iron complex transport system permease protein